LINAQTGICMISSRQETPVFLFVRSVMLQFAADNNG
jgi:hypothetical protein